MTTTTPQVPAKSVGATRNGAIDCSGEMDAAELLTSVAAPVVTPAGLTVSAVAVNAAAVEIDGVAVAIGKAITFKASGGTAGVRYSITFTATTDKGQVLELLNRLEVE